MITVPAIDVVISPCDVTFELADSVSDPGGEGGAPDHRVVVPLAPPTVKLAALSALPLIVTVTSGNVMQTASLPVGMLPVDQFVPVSPRRHRSR